MARLKILVLSTLLNRLTHEMDHTKRGCYILDQTSRVSKFNFYFLLHLAKTALNYKFRVQINYVNVIQVGVTVSLSYVFFTFCFIFTV